MKSNFNKIGAIIAVIIFVSIMALSIWYVPYMISYDQHMVNTVNERAINYTSQTGVVTDFTDATIMQNDASLNYEHRAWMLENKELYYYHAIGIGLLASILSTVLIVFVTRLINDMYYYDDDEDD